MNTIQTNNHTLYILQMPEERKSFYAIQSEAEVLGFVYRDKHVGFDVSNLFPPNLTKEQNYDISCTLPESKALRKLKAYCKLNREAQLLAAMHQNGFDPHKLPLGNKYLILLKKE